MEQPDARLEAKDSQAPAVGDPRYLKGTRASAALVEALEASGRAPETPSGSEGGYFQSAPAGTGTPTQVRLRRKPKLDTYDPSAAATPEIVPMGSAVESEESDHDLPTQATKANPKPPSTKTYVVAADDAELREILRKGLEREKDRKDPSRRPRLRNMVFTRQFSTFDRKNQDAANSPFHGFYVLIWIAVTLLIIKTSADNWRATGSPLGTNEIMRYMFRRDVVVLLISDGVMCGLTGVSWVLQLLVFHDYIDWNRSGWIIQHIWQAGFIASVISLTLAREWQWTHTIFFVLHGLVMLMKQHSYASYNGYLSTIYKERNAFKAKLRQLEAISPAGSQLEINPQASDLSVDHLAHRPSTSEYQQRRRASLSKTTSHEKTDMERISEAIDSHQPLGQQQLVLFERLIRWDIDALENELKGKATDAAKYYPKNLTFSNHYEYIVLPTLVYELQYPRSDSINWAYVAEKATATFGVIFVMIMVSQAFIYPVYVRTVNMKEAGWTTGERFQEFPWMFSELLFPFMMEYLLAWYLIWETVLNTLAELTCFADRSFYDAWWNSVSWDQFARDWNRPVHNFLLRHVYHSSLSSLQVDRHTATLITFFLSACVHELLMWCIFKKLRGYLLVLQMCQLPLVQLSRTRWLRGRDTLGNAMFWVGIFTGPSILCSLYLIL